MTWHSAVQDTKEVRVRRNHRGPFPMRKPMARPPCAHLAADNDLTTWHLPVPLCLALSPTSNYTRTHNSSQTRSEFADHSLTDRCPACCDGNKKHRNREYAIASTPSTKLPMSLIRTGSQRLERNASCGRAQPNPKSFWVE